MTDKPIRRVQQVDQSVAWLAEALLQLMQQRPYKNISISAIANRSGLSRRTFYRHFDTIDALLDHVIEAQVNEMITTISNARPHRFREVVLIFFTACVPQREFLLNLQSNNLMPHLLTQLTTGVQKSLLAVLLPKNDTYTFAFAAGGIWNLLNQWLSDNAAATPEEMGDVAERIAIHLGDIV